MEAKYTRSILDINNGSIVKLIDEELKKVMVNMFDEGTDDKARTLTVKLTFIPKNDKKEMSVKPVITSKLSPKKVKKFICLIRFSMIRILAKLLDSDFRSLQE